MNMSHVYESNRIESKANQVSLSTLKIEIFYFNPLSLKFICFCVKSRRFVSVSRSRLHIVEKVYNKLGAATKGKTNVKERKSKMVEKWRMGEYL